MIVTHVYNCPKLKLWNLTCPWALRFGQTTSTVQMIDGAWLSILRLLQLRSCRVGEAFLPSILVSHDLSRIFWKRRTHSDRFQYWTALRYPHVLLSIILTIWWSISTARQHQGPSAFGVVWSQSGASVLTSPLECEKSDWAYRVIQNVSNYLKTPTPMGLLFMTWPRSRSFVRNMKPMIIMFSWKRSIGWSKMDTSRSEGSKVCYISGFLVERTWIWSRFLGDGDCFYRGDWGTIFCKYTSVWYLSMTV